VKGKMGEKANEKDKSEKERREKIGCKGSRR
jgi:hypothetical protein